MIAHLEGLGGDTADVVVDVLQVAEPKCSATRTLVLEANTKPTTYAMGGLTSFFDGTDSSGGQRRQAR